MQRHTLIETLNRYGMYLPYLTFLLSARTEEELRTLCKQVKPYCQLSRPEMRAYVQWWKECFGPEINASVREKAQLDAFEQARFSPQNPMDPASFIHRYNLSLSKHDARDPVFAFHPLGHGSTVLRIPSEIHKPSGLVDCQLAGIPARIGVNLVRMWPHTGLQFHLLIATELLTDRMVTRLLRLKRWHKSELSKRVVVITYWVNITDEIPDRLVGVTGESLLIDRPFFDYLVSLLTITGVAITIPCETETSALSA